MTFEEMLQKRESCRAYDPTRSVSREDLTALCEAGRLTPSGCNSQPWRFLVVDEPEARLKLCDALVLENGRTGAPWREGRACARCRGRGRAPTPRRPRPPRGAER